MSLNLQRLEAALQQNWFQIGLASSQRPTFNLQIFETLTSTNQTLWELLQQGTQPGTVAIAHQQQNGRGQWGRQWQSPPGGLYLSLALAPNIAAEDSPQLTLCSAWGIAAALREYDIPVRLKWPNDLVIGDRKLGGILTETRVQQGKVSQAVVGVGINWRNPVPDTGINLQTVLEHQPSSVIASLETLTAIVLQGIMASYNYWQQKGIAAVLPSYQVLLSHLDQPVVVNNQTGRIVGVSARGELQVAIASESHTPATETPATETPATEIFIPPGTLRLGYGALGMGKGQATKADWG